MVANLAFNPMQTTNAAGSFSTDTVGYIQGTALNDPTVRNLLSGGNWSEDATLPAWGGIGVSAAIPGSDGGPNKSLGPILDRATNLTAAAVGQLIGFSVFDQDHAMVNTPQSPVPQAGSNMLVNFYYLGSNARIPVKCDPNLAELIGGSVAQKVSWDFVNQQLVPYVSTTVSSGTYVGGSGAVALTTAAAHGLLPGDTFVLDSMAGSGSVAQLNGEWTATAGTTGSTLNFTGPTGLTLTISGGNVSNGGALPVEVLDVQVGNSMTVDYDANTGNATWDRSGTVAVIKI